MAKDYFQDILPPDGNAPRKTAAPTPDIEHEMEESTPISINTNPRPTPPPQEGERSIRNISMPARGRPRPPMNDMREAPGISGLPVTPGKRSSRWWLWGIAGLCVVVLGVLLLVAMRSTTVTVTPRSHAITFDQASRFTAYPAETAATGTLSYTVQVSDLDDSEVVPSSGTVHAEDKASGSITVYNNYQTSPFKLIKNTRFQASNGLIFRTPAEVVIPGKKGSTPGQITVTVIADAAGEEYNVPAGKFTVPGLKSSAATYEQVYAISTDAMAGGFVGEKPGVDPQALQAAISAVRDRLETKARSVIAESAESVIFPDLMQITYQDKPSTPEAGGGARIHQRAHVVIPVFPSAVFAQTVYADANGDSVRLVPGSDFAAQILDSSAALGTAPLQFSLSGQAQLVWNVDVTELASALAGKEQDAFQAIVTQFPGIQEARARIEPFWKSTFPTDPTTINIEIQAPKS